MTSRLLMLRPRLVAACGALLVATAAGATPGALPAPEAAVEPQRRTAAELFSEASNAAAGFALTTRMTIGISSEKCSDMPAAGVAELERQVAAWSERNGSKVQAADAYTSLVFMAIGMQSGAQAAERARLSVRSDLVEKARVAADAFFAGRTRAEGCATVLTALDRGLIDLDRHAEHGPVLRDLDAFEWPEPPGPALDTPLPAEAFEAAAGG